MTAHSFAKRAFCSRGNAANASQSSLGSLQVSNGRKAARVSGSRLLHHLAALTMAVMLVIATAPAGFSETPAIAAPEVARKLASGELVLLDIRTPEEWRETGLADGAWPVSMHKPDFAEQIQTILSVYGASQISLICATGGRSAYVADILAKNGVSGVWDVPEGMFGNGSAPGWIARGLNVVPLGEAMARYKTAAVSWEK